MDTGGQAVEPLRRQRFGHGVALGMARLRADAAAWLDL